MVQQPAFRDNHPMDPSPSPWTFSEHIYGIATA
jgi:hypothetical protein